MFNLEKSIGDWRRQMLAAGIETPVPLEELEIHLREEIERQTKSGLSGQNAFEISVRHIGRPNLLKNEFKKIERNIMKKTLIILLGVFGILFGPAIFLPALAQHNKSGIWSSDIVWAIAAGTAITIVGLGTAVFGLKKRKGTTSSH